MMNRGRWGISAGFFSLVFVLIGCGLRDEVEEACLVSFEQLLIIDTENHETAESGLTDISHFDVDSNGRIFIANLKSKENFIFILDADGGLISAFGGKGQGPGELQAPKELALSSRDELFVTDTGKVVVFDNSGRFIREFRIDSEYHKVIPLKNDRFLVVAVKMNPDLSQSFQVLLCSAEMEELKILDGSKIESFKMADKVNIIPTLVHWERSNDRIFTGNTAEYEIRVFDFDGRLLNRIRRNHEPVVLSDDDRAEYERRLGRYPPELRERFFIPDAFPPFRDIVSGEGRGLFVQTYAEPREGISRYDVFDEQGEFTGEIDLEGYQVKFKRDRLYSLREKASGYKELVVCRMIDHPGAPYGPL